jgi:hypothetical protein
MSALLRLLNDMSYAIKERYGVVFVKGMSCAETNIAHAFFSTIAGDGDQ